MEIDLGGADEPPPKKFDAEKGRIGGGPDPEHGQAVHFVQRRDEAGWEIGILRRRDGRRRVLRSPANRATREIIYWSCGRLPKWVWWDFQTRGNRHC